MSFSVAFLATILDRFVALPKGIIIPIAHPVVWQGWLIEQLEQRLNRSDFSASRRRAGGALALSVLILVTFIIAFSIVQLLQVLPFPWIFEAALASIFLAHRSLHEAVQAVADVLKTSLSAARIQVSHIVGRDTKNLDQHEISRAAVESLAENSSDGIIAPLFWLALLGLPGIAVYKAINTADSMIGHKSEKYLAFGWASAKLDDVVNFVPARLCALFYILAAGIGQQNPWKRIKKAWRVTLRDAPTHVSPNAGWPEAALAGALDFSLGGIRAYQGRILQLPQMGEGRADLARPDIETALNLSGKMSTLALIFVGLLWLIRL